MSLSLGNGKVGIMVQIQGDVSAGSEDGGGGLAPRIHKCV